MINKKTLTIVLIPILIISIGIYGNRLFTGNSTGRVTTRLSFNFTGVDEGLNPHGGVFDAQGIKKASVIQAAIDKVGADAKQIDINKLSQNIMVRGVVPQDAMDRILPKLASGNNTQLEEVGGATYNPTQYEVTLLMDKELNLTKEQAIELLDALVESYQVYFAETFKDTQAIEAAISPIDPERYDYSEYIMLTEGQLAIIKNYLNAKEQVARDFRSPNTFLSFGDLIAQVELIEDVEVGNVKALVDSFMITRDVEKLSIVSESMVQRMKLEKEKYTKQSQDLTQAANTYEKDKVIVMGNGVLLQGLEEEDEEGTLYDQLIQQAVEAQTRANRMSSRQQYYEGLLTDLNNKGNSGKATAKSYEDEVEQNIIYIADQMNKTIENIKTTVNDYYTEEVFEGSITPIVATRYQSNFRIHFIKDTFLIGVLIGIMAMIGIIYLLARKEFKTK